MTPEESQQLVVTLVNGFSEHDMPMSTYHAFLELFLGLQPGTIGANHGTEFHVKQHELKDPSHYQGEFLNAFLRYGKFFFFPCPQNKTKKSKNDSPTFLTGAKFRSAQFCFLKGFRKKRIVPYPVAFLQLLKCTTSNKDGHAEELLLKEEKGIKEKEYEKKGGEEEEEKGRNDEEVNEEEERMESSGDVPVISENVDRAVSVSLDEDDSPILDEKGKGQGDINESGQTNESRESQQPVQVPSFSRACSPYFTAPLSSGLFHTHAPRLTRKCIPTHTQNSPKCITSLWSTHK